MFVLNSKVVGSQKNKCDISWRVTHVLAGGRKTILLLPRYRHLKIKLGRDTT